MRTIAMMLTNAAHSIIVKLRLLAAHTVKATAMTIIAAASHG